MKELILQKLKDRILQKQNDIADAFILANVPTGDIDSLTEFLQKVQEGLIDVS